MIEFGICMMLIGIGLGAMAAGVGIGIYWTERGEREAKR